MPDGGAGGERTPNPAPIHPFAGAPVVAMAAGLVVALGALGQRYGFHRDELYYLWGGHHLDGGFVDHPPLVPALARAIEVLAGDRTLLALRLAAAILAGWSTVACALIARELGGTRRAQTLAALGAVCTPIAHATGILFGTTIADQAVWATVLLLTARLLRTGDPRLWAPIGLVTGLGLQVKWLPAALMAGLVAGLAASPARRLLRTPWLVVGGAIALACWFPNLAWNAANGWPAIEFNRSVNEEYGSLGRRLEFFPLQLLLTGIATVFVWGPGWVWLLRGRFVGLGRGLVVVVGLVFLLGGKPYYVAPLYLVTLAAGAIVLDRAPAQRRSAATRMFVIVGIVSIPLTFPVLPAGSLGPIAPVNKEFGEMVGWPELVATVRTAFDGLPTETRPGASIVTSNYGQGAAIWHADPTLPVYSRQNSMWFAGPPPEGPGGAVLVGFSETTVKELCRTVTSTTTIANDAGLDNDEQGRTVVTCAELAEPWSVIWPRLKRFA